MIPVQFYLWEANMEKAKNMLRGNMCDKITSVEFVVEDMKRMKRDDYSDEIIEFLQVFLRFPSLEEIQFTSCYGSGELPMDLMNIFENSTVKRINISHLDLVDLPWMNNITSVSIKYRPMLDNNYLRVINYWAQKCNKTRMSISLEFD